MSWLKRTLKKAGNTIGDTSKFIANRTLGSPYTILTGKSLIGGHRFKNQKFGKLENKAAKITKTSGRIALAAAGAVAGGAAIGKAIKGGKLLSKSGSGVSKILTGRKKFGSTLSNSLVKTTPTNVRTAKTPYTTTASYLNGSAESSNLLNTFIPKESKVGQILQKLPSIGSILGGAADGAGEVLQGSEAGQEVEKKAINNWLEENANKVFISLIAILLGIVVYLSTRKKSKY
jgi:hypothetical protein